MKLLYGKTLSNGIAIGKTSLFRKKKFSIPKYKPDNCDEELKLLENALHEAKEELGTTLKTIQNDAFKEEIEILKAHETMLGDPDFINSMISFIKDDNWNAAQAVLKSSDYFSAKLEQIDDEYLSARVQDIQDVSARLIKHLLNVQIVEESLFRNPGILVAFELTASDILSFDRDQILGIITCKGGYNDHAAILARAFSIPLITGIGESLSDFFPEQELIIDGNNQTVLIDPDPKTKKIKLDCQANLAIQEENALANVLKECKTTDGIRIRICANIDGIESANSAYRIGADGVGLFRSEFVFLNSELLPSEESQYQLYYEIAKVLRGKELKFRTLDIGSDKQHNSLNLPSEQNPALGLRALRLMFKHDDELLKPQIKAILRVAHDFPVKIMLPMVTSISEIRNFRGRMNICKDELIAENKNFKGDIPLGIMVEVPAVAITIEHFVDEVDFFSIGTNDLTQYCLSADRTNSAVSYLSEGLHPSVLYLINKVIIAAHKRKKPVAICGELAADPRVIPIFIGLGIDELSISPSHIPKIKEMIRAISCSEAKQIAYQSLKLESWEEIQQLTRSFQH
ncbi:MAG: phosphoenolpyruvate--protein phosphotransferase [Bacteroidetes bacterium]|jgi:phosphoenolpyruvate-protein phosphotransferase (PTS system enzyme I)|nr:phosphoenolpyruvate--protein phosphotransferase [Bacteroidota bacterium]MBT7462793.1 phosphoenolpyruvate--protein phosphotransferase [Bacteroidota bacterium]